MKVWSFVVKFHVKWPSTAKSISAEAVKVGFNHIAVAMGATVLITLTL